MNLACFPYFLINLVFWISGKFRDAEVIKHFTENDITTVVVVDKDDESPKMLVDQIEMNVQRLLKKSGVDLKMGANTSFE